MIDRRFFIGAALGSALLPAAAMADPTALMRLTAPGPENNAMARRAGLWDVVETVWSGADAAPVTTAGLVAERRVIGSMLQEILRADTDPAAIDRIDYLSFNRVEGRWDYVSMDIRAPVGIMPAWSFERGDLNRIELTFEPFAIAGAGEAVGGQMLRMTQVVASHGPNRDTKQQYFLLADGSGTKWLAHQYDYTRRS